MAPCWVFPVCDQTPVRSVHNFPSVYTSVVTKDLELGKNSHCGIVEENSISLEQSSFPAQT